MVLVRSLLLANFFLPVGHGPAEEKEPSAVLWYCGQLDLVPRDMLCSLSGISADACRDIASHPADLVAKCNRVLSYPPPPATHVAALLVEVVDTVPLLVLPSDAAAEAPDVQALEVSAEATLADEDAPARSRNKGL